ncbi:MAG: hypothetical protein WCD70_06615 [Alphaproteobacteria bacterium]
MIDWRPHRIWIGLLIVAFIVGAGNAPVLGIAQQNEKQRLASLLADYNKTADELHQLQDDIAATENLKTKIDEADVDKSLAPVDRLRVAQIIERRAAETHLTHFTYTLSPEQKTPIDTVDAGKQELATSTLALTADAPTDTDAYLFFDSLRRTLPGRLSVRQLSLQRIGAADAPVSDANLHLTASGDWLSNGASQSLAEDTR